MIDGSTEQHEFLGSQEKAMNSGIERKAYVDYLPPTPREEAFFYLKQILSYADVWSTVELEARKNIPLEGAGHVMREVKYHKPGVVSDFLTEVANLSPDSIKEEEFTEFYNHLTYFAKFGSASEIAPLIPAILEKVQKGKNEFLDSAFPDGGKFREIMDERVTLLQLSCLQALDEDRKYRVSRETVESIYLAANDHPAFMHYAIIMDGRNNGTEEFANIEDRIRPAILNDILNGNNLDQATGILRTLPFDFLASIFKEGIGQLEGEAALENLVQLMAPSLGIENLRKTLRAMVAEDGSVRPKLVSIFNYIGLDPETGIAVDLEKDVYDKLDFSGYEPNRELLEYETDLLKKEIGENKKVLDIACGIGRLLTALDGQQGIQVSGIDVVSKHAEYIQEKFPGTDVKVGTWLDLPYEDRSFDAAYCLGRSIAHNTTLPDFFKCLLEMRRIIKDDGFIILDLPDTEKGDYPELKKRTYETLSKKGLGSYLSGLINDSPDGEHYFDRYVPSPYNFVFLAKVAGFKATNLNANREYRGISGKENVNMYWKLEKDDEELGIFPFQNTLYVGKHLPI